MAFEANKDIKIEASEAEPGVYVLRTNGLASKRRPELEISGVPEAALNAAAGIINMTADYTVNKAEVLADQNVGHVVQVGDDGRKMMLVVRAVVSQKPSGGLWSKIAGGGKGTLRLVDVTGSTDQPPLTALATMLVHRAELRRAKDDMDGARTELEAATTIFPGDVGAGAPPLRGPDHHFNWQNHLAYLDLASLADDLEDAITHYRDALVRSELLAIRELGATVDAVAEHVGRESPDVLREATRIIEHNLTNVHRSPGPTPALLMLASPIWEVVDEESTTKIARRSTLIPAGLAELYYGNVAAERLAGGGAALASGILATADMSPWRAAWIARDTRQIWAHDDAPIVDEMTGRHAVHGLVSSVLADIARCYRAGGKDDEITARYVSRSESLDAKLKELSTFEGEQYMKALSP